MTSKARVLRALNHLPPDRIPRFDEFWEEFGEKCAAELGWPHGVRPSEYFGNDIRIVIADETPFPSRVETLKEDGDVTLQRDGWGRTVRIRSGAYFYEELDFAIRDPTDLDRVQFESPAIDSRFAGFDPGAFRADRCCLFCKVGGPYFRSSFIRGQQNYLGDIAGDPVFAREVAERVTSHLIAIGEESLRRGDLYGTGIWIFDDLAYNRQPMMSPQSFESLFLPSYRRMVSAFKSVGAAKVCLHSDGNIGPLLDMLIDAGIDAINPVEPKAGMRVATLKKRYGTHLAYIGGMCNAHVLPCGTRDEIAAQAREIIDAGHDGGVVIGAHSIGPDVPVDSYQYYHDLVMAEGRFREDGCRASA